MFWQLLLLRRGRRLLLRGRVRKLEAASTRGSDSVLQRVLSLTDLLILRLLE